MKSAADMRAALFFAFFVRVATVLLRITVRSKPLIITICRGRCLMSLQTAYEFANPLRRVDAFFHGGHQGNAYAHLPWIHAVVIGA